MCAGTHKHHADMQRWGYKALRSLASASELASLGSSKQANASTKGASRIIDAAKELSESKQPLLAQGV